MIIFLHRNKIKPLDYCNDALTFFGSSKFWLPFNGGKITFQLTLHLLYFFPTILCYFKIVYPALIVIDILAIYRLSYQKSKIYFFIYFKNIAVFVWANNIWSNQWSELRWDFCYCCLGSLLTRCFGWHFFRIVKLKEILNIGWGLILAHILAISSSQHIEGWREVDMDVLPKPSNWCQQRRNGIKGS